ncbi:unnamed protein product [Allacma fusca]|uniref:Gustatory receptor n=1 Tax=Allacma fusca TaxID=39272 RepID=A0A8J2J4Y1_9HEXA|nr:unnamed protein product [Allacma fusca]
MSEPLLVTLQSVGYFPLTLTQNSRVVFSYKSLPFIWTVLYIFLLTLSDVTYYTGVYYRGQSADFLGSTERLAYFSVSVAASLFTEILRHVTLWKSKATERFWELNCKRLQEFTRLSNRFDFSSRDCKHAGYFVVIENTCLRSIRFGLIYSFVFSLLTLWQKIYGIQKKNTGWDTLDYVTTPATMFWNFNIAVDVTFTIYMTLFLKVYCSCFRIIAEELREMSEMLQKNNNGVMNNIKFLPGTEFLNKEHPTDSFQVLKDCFRAYELLEELVTGFNAHFSFEIIWQILFSFVFVCIRGFCGIFFLIMLSFPGVFYMICNISIYLWKLYYLASNCSDMDLAIRAVSAQLHRIDHDKIPTSMQSKANEVFRIHFYDLKEY